MADSQQDSKKISGYEAIVVLLGSSMSEDELKSLAEKFTNCLFVSQNSVNLSNVASDLPMEVDDQTPVVVSEASKVNVEGLLKKTPDRGIAIGRVVPKGFKNKASDQLTYALGGLDKSEATARTFVGRGPKITGAVLQSDQTVSGVIYNLRKLGVETVAALERSNAPTFSPIAGLTKGISRRINWSFKSALKYTSFSVKNRISGSPLSRLLFNLLLILAVFAMPILSQDYGASADEFLHNNQAKLVHEYFENGDQQALDQPKTLLHYYGQSFDYVAYWLNDKFEFEDPFEVRHMWNALFGFLAILFAGLLAARLLGYRTAIFTVLFLLVSPRFFAHSMNNPMDIPFATGYIMAIYYMVKYFKGYPVSRWSTGLFMAFGIAIAIGIRVGGILLIPYVFMLLGLTYVKFEGLKNTLTLKPLKGNLGFAITPLLMVLFGYWLSLRFWPYALEDPLNNPLNALKELTNIKNSLSQLFEGKNISSDQLPSHYLPKYISITTPLVILSGLAVGVLGMLNWLRRLEIFKLFIAFSFLFPLLYIIYKGSNVYGGWRHVLFIYPSLVIVASYGWNWIMNLNKHYLLPVVVSGVVLVGVAIPGKWMIQNHPHQYVYFNTLTGGVKGAYGDYEMDYYFRCMREGIEWLIETEGLANRKDTVRLTSNHGGVANNYLRDHDNLIQKYTAYYSKSKRDWEYGVFVNTFIGSYQLEQGYFPPPGTIYTVEVEGVPLAAVVKRTSYADKAGFDAMAAGRFQEALENFQQFVKINGETEEVNYGLAEASLRLGNADQAIAYASRALQLHPEYLQALNILGQAQLNKGDYNGAISSYSQILVLRPSYVQAYYMLAVCTYNLGQFDNAIQYANQAIQVNPGMAEAYQLIGASYQQKGNVEMANQYMQQAQQLKSR